MPASSVTGVGTPAVLQLGTFSVSSHGISSVCVWRQRERERERESERSGNSSSYKDARSFGIRAHFTTSVCVVLGHAVVSDSW